jgi:hypothetical protein
VTSLLTSCVEAGVDFSFRTALRESWGLVNLLQIAGRAAMAGIGDQRFQIADGSPGCRLAQFSPAGENLTGRNCRGRPISSARRKFGSGGQGEGTWGWIADCQFQIQTTGANGRPRIVNHKSKMETLPLSLLNDYLYCPRRAALVRCRKSGNRMVGHCNVCYPLHHDD